MNKIIVIDDEITPESRLGKAIRKMFETPGALFQPSNDPELLTPYEVIFTQSGQEGIDRVLADRDKNEIRLALVDAFFRGQAIHGPTIFEKIKKARPSLMVAILTQYASKYPPGPFLRSGASLFVSKQDFEKSKSKREELKKMLDGIILDRFNNRYLLVLSESIDRSNHMLRLTIDLMDSDLNLSVLRKRFSCSFPYSNVLLEYARCFADNRANGSKRDDDYVKLADINNMNDNLIEDSTLLNRWVYKFNMTIQKLSNGRIGTILEGGGYGESEYRLTIGNVKIINAKS